MNACQPYVASVGLRAAEADAALRELSTARRAWQSAASEVAGNATGGRARLDAAAAALQSLEAAALSAGLWLADALAQGDVWTQQSLLALLAGAETPQTTVADLPLPTAAAEPSCEPAAEDAERLPDGLEPLALCEAPAEPASPPVVVTPDTLQALQLALSGGKARAIPDTDEQRTHAALEALRTCLGGTPAQVVSRSDALDVLASTERVVQQHSTWNRLGPTGRRLMLEGVAARVRVVQELASGAGVFVADDRVAERTQAVVHKLVERARKGPVDRAVHGLAQKHTAQSASWLRDAERADDAVERILAISHKKAPCAFNLDDAFRRLQQDAAGLDTDQLAERIDELLRHNAAADDKRFVRLVEPQLSALQGRPGLARVVRAVSAALDAESESETETPQQSLPANWPGYAHTAGKRAVIVGGDGRQERIANIRQTFGFAELEWPDLPKNAPGKTAALVTQVRNGRYDVVICLQQFISHSVTDQLFGLAIPGIKVVLAAGYGVGQLRLGLERYLGIVQ